MEFIVGLLTYVIFIATALLAIGLYKPWIVLWWKDIQNRKNVFKLYGSIVTGSIVIYLLLKLI